MIGVSISYQFKLDTFIRTKITNLDFSLFWLAEASALPEQDTSPWRESGFSVA